MIHTFLQSFDLFALTYIAGWLIAVLLAMGGVVVVARDQVFIGAAVSQASTLGVATALALGGVFAGEGEGAHGGPTVMAIAFAVGASLLMLRRTGPGRESHEAMTGWVFLFASSTAVLLVAHSPHGLEEVQSLMASTLIGATRLDIALFAAAALATAALLLIAHRRIMLIVMDGPTAAALGLRVRVWDAGMAVWLGLTLGLSLHVAGLLYVFGCLVLPAMVARNLCRRMATMFTIAPLIAVIGVTLGFIWANHYDYPFAQAAVATLAAMLPPAWVYRRLARHRRPNSNP